MKKLSALALLLFLCVFNFTSFTQNTSTEIIGEGGEYFIEKYDDANPEISAQQYEIIEKRCADNLMLLGLDKVPKSPQSVLLSWPLRAAAGFTDCNFYAISAHVDHNTAAGEFTDYNCGTKSYDGHRGTDIFTWPFSFYKMDNVQVEVIAAAAGIILDKDDGHFDRNCTRNSLPANYVIIQHSDGSLALYWHMKLGAVTTKAIGEPVVVGEYLGVVGSSGSSSGPHLHFEIWSGSTNATYNDPYSGNCNNLNANSWWANQKPYTEPAIFKASVHTTDAVFPGCPTTETPNESTSYTIPFQGEGLPPGFAKFYIFLRNATVGTTVNIEILNPDGTVFNKWNFSVTTYYNASYWNWSKPLPPIAGTYTFEATYNGETCSQKFDIITSTGISDKTDIEQFQIYPNPAQDELTISGINTDEIESITLSDLLGNDVMKIDKSELKFNESNYTITIGKEKLSKLCNGMYILRVNSKRILFKNAIIQILK